MNKKTECAKCTKVVCRSEHLAQAPSNCPIKTRRDAIQRALAEYNKPEVKEFARQASIQEFECYMNLPEGKTPRNPRVENEAKLLTTILENRGFAVVSVRCTVGGIPKETIGIKEEQKIEGPGNWETMCNPITQAEILNDEGTEFNIVVGLCVGHDSLFFKYAHAPTTVLIAKDRVFGHNPAMGLYLSHSYYRKLLRKESLGA